MTRGVLLGAALLSLVAGRAARADDAGHLFDERSDPAALEQALAAYTDAAARAPTDPDPRLRLARAEAFWVEAHEDALPSEAIPHLAIGVQAAREALRLLSPGYAEAGRQGFALPQALQAIEPGGALALYWIGADQHQLAALRGLSALFLETDDLRRIFARVIELAPETFHGGAYLHQAELSLALPAGYATSLQTAADALTQAERLGPGWLAVDLVWAERWAVKAQDYGMFKRKLQKILEAPVGPGEADLGPENELVRRRAKKLQGQAAALFTRSAIQKVDPPTSAGVGK